MSPAHADVARPEGYTTLEPKVAYRHGMSDQSGLVRRGAGSSPWGAGSPFSEGKLFDGSGRLSASASSTLLVFERPKRSG